jgi:glycosyltransferase involved in cell wall biosynthesis
MGIAVPRHVVFFSDCPYYGGAEAYLVLLAQARPGPQWRLSALVPEGEPGAILAAKLAEAGVEVVRYRVPPVPSRRQLRSPGSLPGRARAGLARWRQLDRALRDMKGDILHVNLPSVYDARLSIPAYLARRAGYRRIVTTEHLPMVPRARRMLLVKRLLAPAVDAIIVHTEWNRDRLARYHHMPRGRMHVIPNGSAEAPVMSAEARRSLRGRFGIDEGTVALAVVARLTERKGQRFLLEALARLPHAGATSASVAPDWKLLVVGEGETEAALRAQAASLGIASSVLFLGYRDDARELIHAADALVLPSLLETQPLVLTEAMASGRAVLATAIYGIPEIVADGETGLLVPPGEVALLTTALAAIIGDRERREALGRAGRRRYEERFTLGLMGERTYGVLSGEGCGTVTRHFAQRMAS